jgi:zinc protease
MFKSTKRFPAGQFDRLIESAGGESNAATWTDWTYYYENVPKSSFELVAELEADRMHNLLLDQKQLTAEKEVVVNERRYRVEDDVEGAATEQLYSLAIKKHPYHWPTIGWMRDIEAFELKDCLAFYRTYYAPNNAILVLSGDLSEEHALEVIQGRYGRFQAARIPRQSALAEPLQRKERRHQMRFATDTQKLLLGYRAPAYGDPDHAVLTIVNDVLAGGRSSRLHRRLVNEEELASDASGSVAPFRDPGLYDLWVDLREGHTAEEARVILDEEIERLQREPVKPEELEKAQNRLELSFLSGMETASGKAEQIGFCATVLGDPTAAFTRLERYRSITAADVQAACQRYLVPARRTMITVEPT